jgi:GNAT superfamily N-acetyltransferase
MPRNAVIIRKLLTSERDKVRDHLLRLAPEDRRLRFFCQVGDAFIADYCEKLFAANDIVLGAFIDGTLRGVGELRHESPRWQPAAEAAVTVERTYQSSGIGTALLRQLVELAQNRSIKTLHLFCLIDNSRMQSVVKKLGGQLSVADGAVAADINPPLPTCWSLLDEALVEGQAVLQAWWGDRPQRAAPAA